MRARGLLLAGIAGACVLLMLWTRTHDEVPAARAAVVEPTPPVARRSTAPAIIAGAVPAPDRDPPRAVDEREPPEPRDPDQHLAELAAAFAAERADSAWSRTTQTELQTRTAKALPAGSVVTSLECRATLCRLETEHAGLDELDAFIDRAFLRPVPGEPIYGKTFAPPEPRADRRVRSVGYLQSP